MNKFMGTPYPWKWFTSNSHNRLSSEVTGKDGDVIYAFKASDGMVCVNVSQWDMPVIAAAPELLEALMDMVEIVKKNTYPTPDKPSSNWGRMEVAEQIIAKALGQ
ncbi:hypothetical protein M2403_001991 [Rahnella sp. BIGb0603]|uniref:hypothetical protein n=1 Tax=Rahnella sp. BIGb0603 TaxID=2940612 RepID=UPI00216984CD|nr:hypothetical protein [Rahnella sp. BIGb0603]MCS3423390.1 hypothetical protein [Rahnella sp. BIGb0603]